MALSDIPGYVQGFRFSDDSADFYAAGVFKDQAGYGSRNDMTITDGTPSFTTLNGHKGIILDNTVQGGFLPAIPWEGCCIAVMQATMGVNGTIYPVIMGVSDTISSNGILRFQRSSASDYRRLMVTATAGCSVGTGSTTDSGARVAAFATSQETRKGYGTLDGVTIIETAAVADDGFGNKLAPAYCSTLSAAGIKARFGNLSGVSGDVAASANTMAMFELHYFKGNPIVSDAAAVASEIAALKSKYAIA